MQHRQHPVPATSSISTTVRQNRVATLTQYIGWHQIVLALLSAILLLLFHQIPFSYRFKPGIDQGVQSDLPFLQGFHKPENDTSNHEEWWRWSYPTWRMTVAGIGQRNVLATLSVIAHRGQWEHAAQVQGGGATDADTSYEPVVLTLTFDDDNAKNNTIVVPLRLHRATYHLYIPAAMLHNGRLDVSGATDAWHTPHDRRDELGVALGNSVRITSLLHEGIVLPDTTLLFLLPLSLMIAWSSLCMLTFSRRTAFWLLMPLALLLPSMLLVDAPRLAAGAWWLFTMACLSSITALVCIVSIPPLLRRLNVMPPTNALLSWLLLLVVSSVVLKYGGRLYPESMPGDIQLHVNRALKTWHGMIYIAAQHRGLPFPFPNAPYILLFPFLLLGIDLRSLIQLASAIYEATTVLLLYILMHRATATTKTSIIAAAVYAVTAGGFMNSWFSFHTQIAAQTISVVLLALLVSQWQRTAHLTRWLWAVTVTLFVLIFLGHIGLFINTTLVGIIIVLLLWWRTTAPTERRRVVWLFTAGTTAGLLVFLCYYSAFMGLITEQIVGVATTGLNGVTQRDPIPRTTTLHVLWEGGFITHFGFFPVLLAIPGTWLLAHWQQRQHQERGIVVPLILSTFLVSASQALLPLVTLNSITTRWLMFSSWAIAVTAAAAFSALWQKGTIARLIVITMSVFAGWQTLVVYLEALVWRKPPIEPF